MPGRPSRPPARGIAAALVVVALGTGLAGCGADEETAYADGWDGICRSLGGALSTFRTDASSAATTSGDLGDAAVTAGAPAAAVTGDLLKSAQALQTAVGRQVEAAGRLEPPAGEWSRFNAVALRELAVRRDAVVDGVRRIQQGDADALPLLAIGSVGPASVRAPADLRNRTPDCTSLR